MELRHPRAAAGWLPPRQLTTARISVTAVLQVRFTRQNLTKHTKKPRQNPWKNILYDHLLLV